MNGKVKIILLFILTSFFIDTHTKENAPPLTSFQISHPYLPECDIKTDAVFIAGGGKEKVDSWKRKGYKVYVMWGFRESAKYAKKHLGEVQMAKGGFPMMTLDTQTYYFVPTKERAKKYVDFALKAIENGAEGISPEEPEFFARADYSPAFKSAWQEYYKEEWEEPSSSIDARYKSDRLKAKMWFETLHEIYKASKEKKKDIKCFLMVHSPINYSAWGLPFSHSEAVRFLPVDEIIAQVWTGTAKSPIKFRGETKRMIFENAFCEYSSMFNLVRGTNISLWFLHDPVEDEPGHEEKFYEEGYEDTLIASLLFPEVHKFEVMPWPDRIFGKDNRYNISSDYATKIILISNVLREIAAQKEIGQEKGQGGVGVLISDTMMWQREVPYPSDMNSYYGLTIPLIKKGIPVQTMNIEKIIDKDYLKDYKVILLSYDIWKPLNPKYHEMLADWVKKGGVLIFFGGYDEYNNLNLWWKKEGYSAPYDHLFEGLGVESDLKIMNYKNGKEKKLTREKDSFSMEKLVIPPEVPITVFKTKNTVPLYKIDDYSVVFEKKYNKGHFIFFGISPKFFSLSEENENVLLSLLNYSFEEKLKEKFKTSDHTLLRRGKFIIIRAENNDLDLKGNFVDLFDRDMPMVKNKKILKNKNAFLIDLNKINLSIPKVIASASKIENLKEGKKQTSFISFGPRGVKNKTRIYSGKLKPREITVKSREGMDITNEYILGDNSILLKFDNNPGGAVVKIDWE